jgi:hypothetical protein
MMNDDGDDDDSEDDDGDDGCVASSIDFHSQLEVVAATIPVVEHGDDDEEE